MNLTKPPKRSTRRQLQLAAAAAPAYSIFIKRFRVDALIAKVARCGGYDLGFEAELTVTAMSLDTDGFVVHNEKLVDRIRNMFAYGNVKGTGRQACDGSVVWKASCEELTSGIANIVAGMVPMNRLTGMNIRVFNHMGHTAFDWKAGQTVPAFPRRATPHEIEETQRANRESGIQSAC